MHSNDRQSAENPGPFGEVIHDWNVRGGVLAHPYRPVQVHDETIRDGIQSPSVVDPPIDTKLEIVRLLDRLGVASVDVGLPGAGPRAVEDVRTILRCIVDEKLRIRPTCAARTHEHDIRPVIELSQEVGIEIEVMAFLGASPIRMLAERWDDDLLERRTRNAAKLTVEAGLPFCFVTEDTIRSHPTTLRRLFTAAVEEGAGCLCLCDTVGHADPRGVFNLVQWTRDLLMGLGASPTLDWHGHDDRGLGLINGLAAVQAGVDRVHGTVLGVGERVGNTPLDLLLVNLQLLGVHDGDLTALARLVDVVSDACAVPIPVNYPVFGRDAFRTGTGVHAAAVIKAMRAGDAWLADRIYSGVPAGWFGRRQEIEIGHMSGDSNIVFWLEQRGIRPDPELVGRIRARAKAGDRVLREDEIMEVVAQFQSAG
ncbi:MAG: 2-isopropylmalate synthase [Deltaproteobacteria bacterium]|nr:MAG: 2-isopropylmalate synthase [Deltaproteobacteria bacterium]